MKVTSNYINTSTKFTGKNVVCIDDVVKSVMDIFSMPIEQRSHHLFHEFHPDTNKPILGRFKLVASDGSNITVSRSLLRKGMVPVKYISIAIDNAVQNKVIRIDSDKMKIIKSGLNTDVNSEPVKYFRSLNESGFAPILSKYLPEITKYDTSIPAPELKQAVVKRLAKDIDVDKVLESSPKYVPGMDLVNNELKLTSLNKPFRLPITTSVRKMSQKFVKPQPLEIEYLAQKNDLLKINNIIERYKDLGGEMCHSERYKFLVKNFDSLVLRKPGSASIFLKVPNTKTSVGILLLPKKNLMRLTVLDESGNAIRGYLVKDNNKLVSNFNISYSQTLPKGLKYMSTDDYEKIAPQFEADLELFMDRVKELNTMIDKVS